MKGLNEAVMKPVCGVAKSSVKSWKHFLENLFICVSDIPKASFMIYFV